MADDGRSRVVELRKRIEYDQDEAAARELLDASPTSADLMLIIESASKTRTRAWRELVKLGPSNDDLLRVIRLDVDISPQAWQILRTRQPPTRDLRRVIESRSRHRVAAGKMIMRRDLAESDLQFLVVHVRELREDAARRILSANPSLDALRTIYRAVPASRKSVAEKILAAGPTRADLTDIIRDLRSLRKVAAKKLLELDPTEDQLRLVRDLVPAFEDEARSRLPTPKEKTLTARRDELWGDLSTNNPSITELLYLVERHPELGGRAARMLLRRNPTQQALLQIISFCEDAERKAAWSIMEERTLTAEELLRVILRAPLLARRAWKKMAAGEVTPEVLAAILDSDSEVRTDVADRILDTPESSRELYRKIMVNIPSRADRAARQLLEKWDPTPQELRVIIRNSAEQRDRASRTLLERSELPEDIQLVVSRCSGELRKVAVRRLLEGGSRFELRQLLRVESGMESEIVERLLKDPSVADLTAVLQLSAKKLERSGLSTNLKVLHQLSQV